MIVALLRQIPRRFSLRALFLFTGVVAAALAWWRWPIEVEAIVEPAPIGPWVYDHHWFGARHREVRTVRRSASGDRVHDGITTGYIIANTKVYEQYWKNGIRHGPYREWLPDGKLSVEGQFVAGKRSGTWTSYDRSYIERSWPHQNISRCSQAHWQPDRSGVYHLFSSADEIRWVFADDRLVRVERNCTAAELRDEIESVALIDDDKAILTCWSFDRAQKLEEVPFHAHAEHGEARGWHRNGALLYTGQWNQGWPSGVWRYYDGYGKPALELECLTRMVHPRTEPRPHAELFAIVARRPNGNQQRFDVEGLRQYWAGPLRVVIEPRRLDEIVHVVNVSSNLKIQLDNQLSALDSTPAPFVGVIMRGFPAHFALTCALQPHGLALGLKRGEYYITTAARARSWADAGGFPDEPSEDRSTDESELKADRSAQDAAEDPFGDESK